MPDPYKDEESETRRTSLCLYNLPGITKFKRCKDCPGAARSAYHQRRCCPFDDFDFHQGASDPKEKDASRWSASSSKSHSHEADTELAYKVAAMSLADSGSGEFPDIQSDRSKEMAVIHGSKRKAVTEADGEAKFQKKLMSFESEALADVQEYLKSKPEKRFRELEAGNLVMPACVGISADAMDALIIRKLSLDSRPDRPSRSASSLGFYIPCCTMNMESEGCGLLPCNNGIFDVSKPAEAGPMFMDIEYPVPLDQ